MHVGQLLKIFKFSPPKKKGGEAPFFEKLKILFENINEGLYITLETKFRASRSIIEDFEIFTPQKGGEKTPFEFFFWNEISPTEFPRNFPFDWYVSRQNPSDNEGGDSIITYIHTYIHTHIHTYIQNLPDSLIIEFRDEAFGLGSREAFGFPLVTQLNYRFDLYHRAGKILCAADALNRLPADKAI